MFANSLPESVIKRLSIRIKELGGVNLGQGIPSFPTAPHIIVAAKEALSDKTIGIYPNFLGTLELRQAIIDKLNDEYGKQLSADKNILITVGAMEATATTILSLVDVREKVGIITPDYCNHVPQIQLARGKIIELPMDEKTQWQVDIKKIEQAAKKGLKLLLLTNPNNPAGTVISKRELDLLVSLGKLYGFWILADETYGFLSYDSEFVSMLSYMDIYNRIVVVRSFSKEYAMTGWRVGYAIGNDQVISALAKTHDALTGCAPKISQRAALAAITGDQSIVSEYKNILKRRRDLVCKLLDGIPQLSYVKPEGAYYVLPKYQEKTSSVEITEKILVNAGVAVVPGSIFGKVGEGHIRISFAVSEDILTQGLKRLQTFFASR